MEAPIQPPLFDEATMGKAVDLKHIQFTAYLGQHYDPETQYFSVPTGIAKESVEKIPLHMAYDKWAIGENEDHNANLFYYLRSLGWDPNAQRGVSRR